MLSEPDLFILFNEKTRECQIVLISFGSLSFLTPDSHCLSHAEAGIKFI